MGSHKEVIEADLYPPSERRVLRRFRVFVSVMVSSSTQVSLSRTRGDALPGTRHRALARPRQQHANAHLRAPFEFAEGRVKLVAARPQKLSELGAAPEKAAISHGQHGAKLV
jgi:hypothetical protein